MATKVGDIFVRLGVDLSEFASGLQDAKRSLESTGRDLTSVGMTMSAAFTAPLAAIAGFSLKASAGFESAMNKVAALSKDFSNDSASYLAKFKGEMEALSNMAIDLGAKTQYSAKQVADAMGEMAAAGFNASQIMAGMEGVLGLAAAGGMKLAEAAEIAAAVLGGFGISADNMGRVADVLAKAASVSAASVQDLGYAFKYVAPVAKAAGLSFNEIAGAMALLANAGIKGESAGTALRNMMQDMLKPSKQAAEVMQELGLNITKANGQLLPLADIIDQLNQKNITLTQGFTIWGARFSDVLPLIQKGGQALRDMTSDMEKANGSAKKMADEMRRGLAGMWEEFTGSVETLGIGIGRILQPAVEPMLKWLTQLANEGIKLAASFKDLNPTVQVFAGIIVGIPAVLGPLALALGGIFNVLGGMAGGLKLAAEGFSSLMSGASNVLSTIRAMPEMFNNIAFALKNNMVSGLTGGEMALLNLGRAAAGAAAIFAGWQLGSWMRANIPMVRQFGDAVGEIIAAKTGLGNVIAWASGATGALKTAQDNLSFSTKKLEEALRAKGMVVSQGSLSLEDYSRKLTQMAKDMAPIPGQINNYAQALGEIGKIQRDLAGITSKITIGVTNKDEIKTLQIQLEDYIKRLKELQTQTADAAKAGRVDKEKQLLIEKQLADAISVARSNLQSLGGSASSAGSALNSMASSHDKAEKAARRQAETEAELASISRKVADVLNDLPKDFKAFESMTEDGFRATTAIKGLKELLSDLKIRFKEHLTPAIAEYIRQVDSAITRMEAFKKAADWKELERITDGINKQAQELAANVKNLIAPAEWMGQLKAMETAGYNTYGKLDDAFKRLGVTSTEVLTNQAKLAEEAFRTVSAAYDKGQVSLNDYRASYLAMLEAQIKLKQNAGEDTKALEAQAEALRTSMGIVVSKTKEAGDGMSELVEFGKQVSTIVTDMGKGLADAILTGRNMGEVLTNAFKAIKEAALRFVLEGMINGVLKSLKDGEMQMELFGFQINKVFGKLKDWLGTIFGADKAASAAKTTTDIAGAAGNTAVDATGAATKATSGVAGGLMNSIMGWTNFIGTALSAVMDTLSYFQGRRMEQDIGRIEVTSRGVLNQLISIQETLNRWLPSLDPAGNFQLNTIRTMTGAILSELETIKEHTFNLGLIKDAVWRMVDRLGSADSPAAEAQQDLEAAARELQKTLDKTNRQTEDTADAMKQTERSADGLDSALLDITKTVEGRLTSSLDGYTSAVGDSAAAMAIGAQTMASTLQTAGSALAEYTGVMTDTLTEVVDGAASVVNEAWKARGWSEEDLSKLWNPTTPTTTPGQGITLTPLQQAAAQVTKAIQDGISAGISLLTEPLLGSEKALQSLYQTQPYYVPPATAGIALRPLASNFNLTVQTSSSDGRQIANQIITTLRSHGVDM